MSFSSLLLIAIGLSMDAFGASISRAATASARGNPPRAVKARAVKEGLVFGLFATIAPLAGWVIGSAFYAGIEAYDHWIAFALLSVVGLKMVRDGWAGGEPAGVVIGYRALVLLMAALATSIDAVAVGIMLPMLQVHILLAAGVIGFITFLASVTGTAIGVSVGAMMGRRAEIVGGIVLIGIGTKIVIEHTLFAAAAV